MHVHMITAYFTLVDLFSFFSRKRAPFGLTDPAPEGWLRAERLYSMRARFIISFPGIELFDSRFTPTSGYMNGFR